MRQRTLDLNPKLLPTRATHTEPMAIMDMRDFYKHVLQTEGLWDRA